MAHPNERNLQTFLAAYASADRQALAEQLADDVVWHVAGNHRFSGDYRGRQEVLDYFERVGEATGETLRLEPVELLANDTRGAAFLRVTAERVGQALDVTMAEAFTFDADGRIREFWAHANDQRAIDEFWGSGAAE